MTRRVDAQTSTGGLRIAMIGQKGLPATYGGIEQHVEQLGRRLVEHGHEVTVYCRNTYSDDIPATFHGMRLVSTPTVATRSLDAIVHSATSSVHALRQGYDIVHYHAIGPGLIAPLPRVLSRSRVALTVHGLDHQRAKWGGLARVALGTAHWMSGRVPDEIVTVSEDLARHYRDRFGREVCYIPNGVNPPAPGPLTDALVEQGVQQGRYVLFVARLVPEKRADLLMEAFARIDDPTLRLVVVGDSGIGDSYGEELRALAAHDPRVIFTGFVFGPELGSLYANAGIFVQPSALEGLPLTLLEAVSYGVPVLASDIAPHREILGAGSSGHRLFAEGDVAELEASLRAMVAEGSPLAQLARSVAPSLLEPYSWDHAAKALSDLYWSMTGRGQGSEPRLKNPAGSGA